MITLSLFLRVEVVGPLSSESELDADERTITFLIFRLARGDGSSPSSLIFASEDSLRRSHSRHDTKLERCK